MRNGHNLGAQIRRQFHEVRVGGLHTLLRKLRSRVRRLRLLTWLNALWAVPAVGLIRVIRPLVLVRVGMIDSTRIGHFVYDGAEQIARLNEQPPNTVDWFWMGPQSNAQWGRMMRRTVVVRWWVRYLDEWNLLLPGGASHARPSTYTRTRDVTGMTPRYKPAIEFLSSEEDVAREWLTKQGWKAGEPFVCLLVRDDEYLANDPLHGRGDETSYRDWAYHSYRNSEIETYLPAIKWLTGQGVWVLRMGKLMSEPLTLESDRFIDYAFDPGKSDLLDIWLFANADGTISTSSGPDAVAMVYQRPVLFVNALPLSHITSYSCSVWVPKNLQWSDSGEDLTIREHLENNFTLSESYVEGGIEVVDLTPDEILAAVEEFWLRACGSWQESPLDVVQQQRFWDVLRAWPSFDMHHDWLHPEARVGRHWLSEVLRGEDDRPDFTGTGAFDSPSRRNQLDPPSGPFASPARTSDM